MSSVVCVQAVYLQKAFAFTYVQKPLRTKSLYVQSLYPCTLLFIYSSIAGAALKSKRTSLLALLSFLERFGLCRDGGLLGMTVGQSSRRKEGVCVVFLVALRVFSDSKDTELRTLEMTLPLCHVKSVRRHRGTAVRFASPLERCRASFEHSLLDVGRCNSF